MQNKSYARGLYGKGYGSDREAPKLPKGGDTPPADEGTTKKSEGSSCCGDVAGALFGTTGTVQDDSKNLADLCYCVQVDKATYDKAVDAANSFERKYELKGRNCVDFMYAVAEAEGTKLPEKVKVAGVASSPKETLKKWREAKETDPNIKPGEDVTPRPPTSESLDPAAHDHDHVHGEPTAPRHAEQLLAIPGIVTLLERDLLPERARP